MYQLYMSRLNDCINMWIIMQMFRFEFLAGLWWSGGTLWCYYVNYYVDVQVVLLRSGRKVAEHATHGGTAP